MKLPLSPLCLQHSELHLPSAKSTIEGNPAKYPKWNKKFTFVQQSHLLHYISQKQKTLLQPFYMHVYAPVRWFASVLLFGPEADTLPDKHTQHKG